MKILSTRLLKPELTERDPSRSKLSHGLENVKANTTGDAVVPSQTFVVFKDKAVKSVDDEGHELIQVRKLDRSGDETVIQEGWIPKEAFQDVGDALYLPTYEFSTTSSLIGGVTRGLVTGGLPGAVTGAVSSVAVSKFGGSAFSRMATGTVAGTLALTAYQAASFGNVGLGSALFAGSLIGVSAAAAGDGDAAVRDAMLGGSAAGLAATMTTGLPLGVLTGAAATAIGAKAGTKAGQILLSVGLGAALTATQALISGNSVPLALGIGAAIGGVGSIIGQPVGQATRNLQQAIAPSVNKVVSAAMSERGETSFQVAAAVPQALTFGSLGASVGLLAPALTPIGIAVGAAAGGLHGFLKAGDRIDELKELQKKHLENLQTLPQNPDQVNNL